MDNEKFQKQKIVLKDLIQKVIQENMASLGDIGKYCSACKEICYDKEYICPNCHNYQFEKRQNSEEKIDSSEEIL